MVPQRPCGRLSKAYAITHTLECAGFSTAGLRDLSVPAQGAPLEKRVSLAIDLWPSTRTYGWGILLPEGEGKWPDTPSSMDSDPRALRLWVSLSHDPLRAGARDARPGR